jgi:hypothetical protein
MLVNTLWATFSPTTKWQLLAKSRGKLETLTMGDVRDAMIASRNARAMARTVVAEIQRAAANTH